MPKDNPEKPEQELIIDGATGALIVRAEIDSQIATAKQFPRDVIKFQNDLRALVTTSLAIAEQCTYAVPRDGKSITGPSARFAELLVYTYGNTVVAGRIIDVGPKRITAQGVARDLENNNTRTIEVIRSIVGKGGKRYSEDMIRTTCQAAIAIACRNATLAVIPRAIWEEIHQASIARAEQFDADELPARIQKMMQAFEGMGINPFRVFARAKVKDAAEITPKKFSFLRALYVGVKDGDMTPDEAFPPIGGKSETGNGSSLDRLAEDGGKSEQAGGTAAATGSPDESRGEAAKSGGTENATAAQETTEKADPDHGTEQGPTAAAGESAAEAESEQPAEGAEAPVIQQAAPVVTPYDPAELASIVEAFKKQISRAVTQKAIDKVGRQIEQDAKLPQETKDELFLEIDAHEAELGL